MPERILLVDDNKADLSLFKHYLEGFTIVECLSGEEALKLLVQKIKVDLVILDVFMPGLNGLEVLQRIRQTRPELKVIIITAYNSEIAIEALRNHADDFIDKDSDADLIRKSVERVLDSKILDGNGTPGIKNKIERIKRFIERNYYKKISLNNAACLICLSPKYLSRLFKQYTGVRFGNFKIGVKVDKAKDLLRQTDYSIDNIIEKLGYDNLQSFVKQFKKLAGLSPIEYHRRGTIRK